MNADGANESLGLADLVTPEKGNTVREFHRLPPNLASPPVGVEMHLEDVGRIKLKKPSFADSYLQIHSSRLPRSGYFWLSHFSRVIFGHIEFDLGLIGCLRRGNPDLRYCNLINL